MNKDIDSIRSIDTLEQQCVVNKCMLKSPRLEDHMKTIGIDKLLCNRSSFEYKCLNNIIYIYKHAGECDYQQNLKDILNDAMVFTPEEITDDNPIRPMTKARFKKPSAWKSLCLFTNTFYIKNKTEKRCIGAAESKRRP